MKPHIVFLSAWYPDDHDPMFGLFVQKHAALLTSQYKVSVLHVTYRTDKKSGIYTHDSQDIHVTNLNISTKNKIFRWFSFLIAGLKAYRHVCKTGGKPVLNHVHILTRMGVLAWLIKCHQGIPFVVTEHWSRYFPVPGTYRNPIRKRITKCVCRHAAGMSAVSQRLEDAMKGHGLGLNKRWLRINNVVDDSVFTLPGAHRAAVPVRFVNVSCFEDRSKNLSGLIEAVEALVKEGFPIECVLAGTGEDWEMIKEQVNSKHLEKYIVLTGLLSEIQVAEQMKNCHFYVQPSNYENVPVVISEALMCGLPVVATRVGGLGEMINESNGFLVDPEKPLELLAALKMMIDNFRNFDQAAIRANAQRLYSPDAVRSQLIDLYTGVIK